MPAPRHLDEFIKDAKQSLKRHEYVIFPGFKFLYVRYVTRYIDSEFVHPVIDLANMEAEKPGDGSFTYLVSHIKRAHPDCWVYVESVVNPRFAKKLLKMGFITQPVGLSECFYIRPQEACPICERTTALVPTLRGRICPECAALPRKEVHGSEEERPSSGSQEEGKGVQGLRRED